jgi:hypothetical protein
MAFLEGGQSCPQPPFRRPEPAESRLRPRLAALQKSMRVFVAAGHTLEETLRDEIAWFRQRQVN